MGAFGGADGARQPVELVDTLARLQGRPRELADADKADVGPFHEREVGLPAAFRPLLRIPGHPQEQRLALWLLGSGHGPQGQRKTCRQGH